jgi:hypothetical protein
MEKSRIQPVTKISAIRKKLAAGMVKKNFTVLDEKRRRESCKWD